MAFDQTLGNFCFAQDTNTRFVQLPFVHIMLTQKQRLFSKKMRLFSHIHRFLPVFKYTGNCFIIVITSMSIYFDFTCQTCDDVRPVNNWSMNIALNTILYFACCITKGIAYVWLFSSPLSLYLTIAINVSFE